MPPLEKTQTERQHIFAINTSPDFLEVIRDLLQSEDYNVTTSNFVPDSFDQITALQPSLLIVDLAPGDQAGWDLLDRLETDAPTIPVIVVSTSVRFLDEVKSRSDRYAGQRFLRKPLDLTELLHKIEELIGTA